MNVFSLQEVTKSFGSGTGITHALNKLNLDIPRGHRIAIVGHSGAGKSTLLNLLGALDSPTGGKILFDSGKGQGPRNLRKFNAGELDDLRKDHFGFVFQKANLLDHLSVQDNVSLVLMLLGVPASERSDKAKDILDGLGLSELAKRHPSQLSGGERQRVAVARALAHNPEVVFADEPTGNLDPENSEKVFSMLSAWQKSAGRSGQGERTLILVTHNIHAAVNHCDLIVVMKGGKVVPCGDKLVNSPEEIAGRYCKENNVSLSKQDDVAEISRIAELGLLEMLRGRTGTKGNTAPVFIQNILKGSIRLRDMFRLAWEDLARVQHAIASVSNIVLILCATLLGFAGVGFFRGGENLRSKVEELGPRALTVDGLRVASLDKPMVEKIYQTKLSNGKLIADPGSRPVHLWNTVQLSFITNFMKEMEKTGFQFGNCKFEAFSSTGRTISQSDPYLSSRNWEFSSPEAMEIIASADFLKKIGSDPKEGAMVFIDTGAKPLALTVTHVFEQDPSLKANYVIPDGLYQAFREGAYKRNDYPSVAGTFMPRDPNGIASLPVDKINSDHIQPLGLEMARESGFLSFKVKDENSKVPAKELEILAMDGLKSAGVTLPGFFIGKPAPSPAADTQQYGRATVYLEKMEDLEPAVQSVRQLGLDPVDPQKIGMVRLFVKTVRPLIWIVLSFATIVMLVVLANLVITMMDRVRQKWVEISIYRACGMSVTKVAWVFFIEGVMLSIPAVLGAYGFLELILLLYRGGKDDLGNNTGTIGDFFELGTMDSLLVMGAVSVLCAFACLLTTYLAKVRKLARSLT